MFVAPVFNGTGIATKNVLAMAHGIPLVTTKIGLNGLGLQPGQSAVLATDEPHTFAQHALTVQTSIAVFERIRQAALQHTRDTLSVGNQRPRSVASLVATGVQRYDSGPPQVTGRWNTIRPSAPSTSHFSSSRSLQRNPTKAGDCSDWDRWV